MADSKKRTGRPPVERPEGKVGTRALRQRVELKDREPLPMEPGDSPQLSERKQFANRLLALAQAEGLTQLEFEKETGIAQGKLAAYLTGLHQTSLGTLQGIAKFTDANLYWLLFGEGGTGPAYRGQSRTQPKLELEVAAHVRRELQASGHSQYAVDHYLPAPDALLALAAEAARKAAVDEYARRRTAYFWEVQRIASRYAHGFQRADGFVAIAAAPTAASSMTSRWAEILANGAAEPDSEEFPLYDAGEALPALAELLASLSPADSPAIAIVLQGESPSAFFWRMAGRMTLEGDPDDVLEHRRSQPEAPIYARAAEWCLAQRWEKSPDRHFQGHTRWVWSGPVDASAPAAGGFAVWARSQLAGVPD